MSILLDSVKLEIENTSSLHLHCPIYYWPSYLCSKTSVVKILSRCEKHSPFPQDLALLRHDSTDCALDVHWFLAVFKTKS